MASTVVFSVPLAGPGSGSATTLPGTVIISPSPFVGNRIPGPQSDGSDFFGIGIALVAILVAIALTRLIFRRRPGQRQYDEAYPAAGEGDRPAAEPRG